MFKLKYNEPIISGLGKAPKSLEVEFRAENKKQALSELEKILDLIFGVEEGGESDGNLYNDKP